MAFRIHIPIDRLKARLRKRLPPPPKIHKPKNAYKRRKVSPNSEE
jgi:hypothetical protein